MKINPPRKKRGGRPILCLDFDGVLNSYAQGFQGPTTIDDEPVPGAVDFVRRAQEHFNVVIYSSRSSHPGGIEAMQRWMEQHGFPQVSFAREKPAAFLTLDDRALTFTGVFPDPAELRSFRPWNRQPEPDLSAEAEAAGGPGNSSTQEETRMLYDLVCANRSYRRFYQEERIEMETLRSLVELARLTPSGSNLQPLKYILSNDPELNARIYPTLAWAGYLRDWPGPDEGERPSAYIVILGDTSISKSFGCDHGIAAQTIMLGAAEQGLGGCMIGSVRRGDLVNVLDIPAQYEILLVLALGKPKEVVQVDLVGPDGSVKYWRDEERVHHVPKRSLDEIILK